MSILAVDVEGVLSSPAGNLHTSLCSFCVQLQSRALWSNASGDAMGVFCLESGAWWRVDLDENVRNRLHNSVCSGDDLSINALELAGTVMTAWAFIVLRDNTHNVGEKSSSRAGITCRLFTELPTVEGE